MIMSAIGSLKFSNRLVLAPLAGFTDLPFRLLCREYGADLCVSEMISCHGLVYRQAKTVSMLESCPADKPVSFQLFGADPEVMGDAAAILSTFEPDIIDINMGCPVKKVTKRGAGAALMTDIFLAEKIIKSIKHNSNCPVTVKIRSGPDSSSLNAEDFARMSEACGASAVTIHGRTWKQSFSGEADWNIVKQLKKSVSIPVIGNGDILSFTEAMTRLNATGCDAVMIGRAALGNPWVFHPAGKPETTALVAQGALRHIELIEQYNENPLRKIASLRNHLGKYFKGFTGSSSLRRQIYEVGEWHKLKKLLVSIHNATDPGK